MEIEKLSFEEFKNTFVNRALGQVRKLSQVQVKHLGFLLWKDAGLEVGKKQIMELNQKFTSDEEVVQY